MNCFDPGPPPEHTRRYELEGNDELQRQAAKAMARHKLKNKMFLFSFVVGPFVFAALVFGAALYLAQL